MSTPPEQPPVQPLDAHPLRDLLVRFLVDSSLSEPRLQEAGALLEQIVADALARQEASTQAALAQIGEELAALREHLAQIPVGAGLAGADQGAPSDLGRQLQQVRGEIAALAGQVQTLTRAAGAGRPGAGPAAPGSRGGRLAQPGLIAVGCGIPLVYALYLLSHSAAVTAPAPAPAQQSSAAPASVPDLEHHRRAAASTPPEAAPPEQDETASSGSQPEAPAPSEPAPLPARPSLAWGRAWDLAITQPFSCPGDPGAGTLLQCACPDVHPAPPPGYPYEGVGERCPPGPRWNGGLAIAALQAVLRVEEPEVRVEVTGLPGRNLSLALARLVLRCSLQAGPELRVLLAPEVQPGADTAAVQVLELLRASPDCIR